MSGLTIGLSQSSDTPFNDTIRRKYKLSNSSTAYVTDISYKKGQGQFTAIYVGAFGPEGFNNIGGCHLSVGGRFLLNGLIGPTGGSIDANIFFKNKFKEKSFTGTIGVHRSHVGDYTINDQITRPVSRIGTSGFHFGYLKTNYNESKFSPIPLTSHGAFLGYSVIFIRHTKWKVEREDLKKTYFIRGSMFNRFNLDIIQYFNQSYAPNYQGRESARKNGFRLYFDGCTNTWSGATVSYTIHYMLGIGINANDKNSLPILAGLGLGLSF
ncbi:MAG: hypothetical protein H6599_07160 [Flavobacteriales bacterium]|nr:hypothetical protein [Flavobacteriales bacterium]